MEKIKLASRGVDNYLVPIDNNTYKLQTEFNYRVGFKGDTPNECTFIDPAGGPFITVGDKIANRKVKAIYSNGLIKFEE